MIGSFLPALFSSPMFKSVIGSLVTHGLDGLKTGAISSLKHIMKSMEEEPPAKKQSKTNKRSADRDIHEDDVDWNDDTSIRKRRNRKRVR